ncbi:hypothetical protein R3P38DRAFT_2806356 [Favolaschia claudopus]|uniref:Uncharacterized protein n=1 Tax=Favolaschia claudopus TaxID=2862362 RepID=A0AAV9ZKJ5_9AGAR
MFDADHDDNQYDQGSGLDDNPGMQSYQDSSLRAASDTNGLPDPESKYNNGKGIDYILSVQPLLPPPKPNEKRRKNTGKLDPINQTIFAHEEDPLGQLLEAAIKAVDAQNVVKFKIVAGNLRLTGCTLTWSIQRTEYKKMKLASADDYDNLIEKATEKAKPLLTNEETEMAETTAQLKALYSCADKQCSFTTCFLGNPSGEHIAKIPEVDIENPPPDKMFRPAAAPDMVDDIDLLATRRRNNLAAKSTSPAITINNDFTGFAEILLYSGQNIPTKLAAKGLELEGPHLISFLSNSDLDNYLIVSDRLRLRYAHDQWQKGRIS